MQLEWSEDAIDALEAIYERISQRSPLAAERLALRILNSIDHVLNNPQIGRAVPEYDNPRFREVIVGRYRVMYRLHADGITIETVMDGATRLRD